MRHRLDWRGNLPLSAALHRTAVTRARMPVSTSQRYMERRLREDKSHRGALCALKRQPARRSFSTISPDLASGRRSFALT